MVHMYDRQSYVDNLQFGLTTVAHTLPTPNDPLYRLIEERGLPQYPYDLTRAERLMGEAGWTRGPDGIYRNAAGVTFDIEVITKHVSDDSFRLAQASADMLKRAGLNATSRSFPNEVPTTEDRRQRSTFKGLFASVSITNEPRAGQQFLCSGIRLDVSGINIGSNSYRYCNQAYDELYDRYVTALDPAGRQHLRADLFKLIAEEVPAVPLFYSFQTVSQTIRSNVRGPGWVHPTQYASGANIHLWEVA
jgi:peptide/nickel transport system substrate-binding protein